MYWNWTEIAQITTQSWVIWVARYGRQAVEQKCLEMLLERGVEVKGIRVTNLPEPYCYIDNSATDPTATPVIYHHQSSREYKNQI